MNNDCPRCRQPIKGYPASSRLDNKTDICSPCGQEEALWDYFYPRLDMPAINERIFPQALRSELA